MYRMFDCSHWHDSQVCRRMCFQNPVERYEEMKSSEKIMKTPTDVVTLVLSGQVHAPLISALSTLIRKPIVVERIEQGERVNRTSKENNDVSYGNCWCLTQDRRYSCRYSSDLGWTLSNPCQTIWNMPVDPNPWYWVLRDRHRRRLLQRSELEEMREVSMHGVLRLIDTYHIGHYGLWSRHHIRRVSM